MPTKAKKYRPSFKDQPKARKIRSHDLKYDARWERAIKLFRSENPLCVHCLREGHTKAVEEVDHIIPHNGDYDLFWDWSNWQSLCKSHHSRKTVKEDGGFGHGSKSRRR